ncbi:MAG: hypothetical protein R6V10_16385 [bacterium]
MSYRVSLGAEVEAYTINLDNYSISRHFRLPHQGVVEKDESYHRDRSIGIEYASRPFNSIRESLFGIKSGLRKSLVKYRQGQKASKYTLFFTGSWRDRFAATHFHVGLGEDGIEFDHARRICRHLHGHLPLLIALLANSPVYMERITTLDSNRFIHGGEKFFYPLKFGELDREYREEMTYNRSRKKRTPTLEIRPCDANLPEYIVAGLVIIKAVSQACLSRRNLSNRNRDEVHLLARNNAARYGPAAVLYWNNRPLRADSYLDRFFREYHTFLSRMEIPPEVIEVFKLFQQGWNGAGILRRACRRHQRKRPRAWSRYFAKDYGRAINLALSGETVSTFARTLGLRPPSTAGIKLGDVRW